MYHNQYLILSKPLSEAAGLDLHPFSGLYLYHHQTLNVTEAAGPGCQLICLGYLIDPFKPEADDQAILGALARSSPTLDDLFRNLTPISGRYVILYKNRDQFAALSDPFAQRQLYASRGDAPEVLTSSPKMFLDLCRLPLLCSPEKSAFIAQPEFRKNESAWFGDSSLDDRLLKVLPNHYLDLTSNQIRRMPFGRTGTLEEEESLDLAGRILAGSIRAATNRFLCLQPVTAGWDSRVLLAAAKEVRDRIQFYVFDDSKDSRPTSDAAVAGSLSDRLELHLKTWRASSLRDDFRELLEREQMTFQSLRKRTHIQYLFDKYRGQRTVRISGIGAETARCFYGFTSGRVTSGMLQYFSHYPKSEFVARAISAWRTEASTFAAELNVSLLDLFYWEQRIGNWASVYAAEQDIAAEEFCPFGNRTLLLTLLSVPAKQRCSPRYRFFFRLIESLWPEAALPPPGGRQNWLTAVLKRQAKIRYHKMRLLDQVGRSFGFGQQIRST